MHQVFIEGGLIRKLWDVETHAYRDHLLQLDHESRRNRFCGAIAEDTIRSYAATRAAPMWSCTVSLFDGVLRGVADLRIVRPLDLHEAEAAFSIEKPWQSHGVGSLFERTQLIARNRGIKHMQVCCLMENQRMQHLARKFEAEIAFDFGSMIGTMENSRPTPLSLMREVVADGHSFAAAYLDFQSRVLR